MKKNKLNVAIIGAGRIGAFFDDPKSKEVLTHAHAYTKNSNFKIVGFVDISYKRAIEACKLWGGHPYKNVKDLFLNETVDIISICTPESVRLALLGQITKYGKNIKGGIIEKPLANNLSGALKIKNNKFFSERKFLVNYPLRFTPQMSELKKRIEAGDFGKFLGGQGNYGKGLIHHASHMIDLLMFLGVFKIKRSYIVGKEIDFSKKDPSYSLLLKTDNNLPFFIRAIPTNLYMVFETDMFFEKGRIRIIKKSRQIEIYAPQKDKLFKGYINLELVDSYAVERDFELENMVKGIYEAIINNKKIVSNINDSVELHRVLDSFKK